VTITWHLSEKKQARLMKGKLGHGMEKKRPAQKRERRKGEKRVRGGLQAWVEVRGVPGPGPDMRQRKGEEGKAGGKRLGLPIGPWKTELGLSFFFFYLIHIRSNIIFFQPSCSFYSTFIISTKKIKTHQKSN